MANHQIDDESKIIKHKGPEKGMVDPEWFEKEYENPSRTELVLITAHFRIDWKKLDIRKKDSFVKLGVNKRKAVYQGDQWVDTEPIEVKDFSYLNKTGIQIIKGFKEKVYDIQNQNLLLKERLAKAKEAERKKDSTISHSLSDNEEPPPKANS